MSQESHLEKVQKQNLRSPASFLSHLKGHVSHFFSVAVDRYHRDLLSLQAMGLTYVTLLSLVPFLAVTFAILAAFGIQYRLEPVLAQALEPLGSQGQEITDRVIEFVENIRAGVLGAVGVAAFFYTVISLVSKIEDALNRIWRVHRSRSWGQRVRDYLSVVLVGPVLVFTAFAFIASAQSSQLVQHVLQSKPVDFIVVVVTRLMPFVFLCAAFTFVYKFVTNAKVRLSAALIGGAVAAILWQLAGIWFAAFVVNSARYAAVYSSFAILILFFIWLYVGWLIVLVGSEVAYFYQFPNAYLSEPALEKGLYASREQVGLLVLIEITRRYLSGRMPCSVDALVESLGIPPSSLDAPLNEFVRDGILLRTVEPAGLTLGRPPDRVLVADVLELLHGATAETSYDRERLLSQVLSRRDQAARDALDGVTLSTLAVDAPPSWA